jgi:hypothetical protein
VQFVHGTPRLAASHRTWQRLCDVHVVSCRRGLLTLRAWQAADVVISTRLQGNLGAEASLGTSLAILAVATAHRVAKDGGTHSHRPGSRAGGGTTDAAGSAGRASSNARLRHCCFSESCNCAIHWSHGGDLRRCDAGRRGERRALLAGCRRGHEAVLVAHASAAGRGVGRCVGLSVHGSQRTVFR